MAQMLVVQKAVNSAERGELEHSSDILDDMGERFMYGAPRLRSIEMRK